PDEGFPRIVRHRVLPYRETLSSPPPPAFFRRFRISELFGPRRHCRFASEHEQKLAAVDAGERLARDARKPLSGVAIDVDHFGNRKSRRIRSIDARRQQSIAD